MRSEYVTIGNEKGMTKLLELEQNPVPKLSDLKDSDEFVAFYREIDYSAAAHF